jgi:hypothetical protein
VSRAEHPHALALAGSIASGPRSTGASTAGLPAVSSVMQSTFLTGPRPGRGPKGSARDSYSETALPYTASQRMKILLLVTTAMLISIPN